MLNPSEPQDLRNFLSVVRQHRGAEAAKVSRAGAVIRSFRPAYRIEEGKLQFGSQEVTVPPKDFSEEELKLMRELATKFGPSVGRVEVAISDDDWVPIGTAFRVSDHPKRMATARHVLQPMMTPNAAITQAYPFKGRGTFRKAQVVFGDENSAIAIDRYIWPHPRWDLLLFDLEDDPNCESFDLETDTAWGNETLNPTAIISYPMQLRLQQPSVFESAFGQTFEEGMKTKHLSPGRVTCIQEVSDPLHPRFEMAGVIGNHDATTLPGSSGAPVISLVSGKVVGLHYSGGSFEQHEANEADDPNLCVNIPAALQEMHLRFEMHEKRIEVEDVERVVWDPKLKRIRGVETVELASGRLENAGFVTTDRMLNSISADRPDFRDRFYEPPLIEAPDQLIPARGSLPPINDQKGEASCVGLALATTINFQLSRLNRGGTPVSARMLYENARLYDEWIEDYRGGSSLRGAIKGFFHSGVCSEKTAPYRVGEQNWSLSRHAAKEARKVTLGGYYRLRPRILDFQVALAQAGAVIVTAHIHKGWEQKGDRRIGKIRQSNTRIGTHAFVLVGYDQDGFLIRNSWGKDWSRWNKRSGLAHWSYQDWADNLMDAWVMRLAPSTPDAFDIVPRIAREEAATLDEDGPKTPLPHLPRPRRFSLLGHAVHVERDEIVDFGRIGMGLASLRETALYLRSTEGKSKYNRIALFFHDPMLGEDALSRLCGHLIEPFKANGIYPLHIVYGLDEARSIFLRLSDEAKSCSKRIADSTFAMEKFIEARARKTCARPIASFLNGADDAAQEGRPLWKILSGLTLETGHVEGCYIFGAGMGAAAASACVAASRSEMLMPEIDGVFLLAPILQTGSAPMECIGKSWTQTHLLPTMRPAISDIEGYRGDWIDLCRSGCELPTAPVRNDPGARNTIVTEPTLARACAEAKVLNSFIASIIGRAPSSTRSYQEA